ncbi:PHD finger protein [Actinidia chinensis var. chinensis]|uniref:PHD finger protein n=1 Tax=Actinidia chinensis var. chinensis TaxID=1590841 RepID=A0A2R6R5N8_ACTCC|nr:PHD finger protein [Actinidia chinensis var. chinensis]
MTTEDVEDWIYHQLEDTTHLLHGVVHTNGFGHLLRVNGREGGSRVLSGCRIMDFWDRLCKLLGVRKVSLLDVSKKYGLEYRLLYAITKGHPWYGDWGYEFGAGSFALTLDAYKTAVETLSKQPLLEHESVSVNGATSSTNSAVTNHPSEEHLLRDLRYLYGSMLRPQTMVLNNAPQANRDLAIISATKLLDCKQFVKDYHPENKLRTENPLAIHLSCEAEVELMEQSEDVAPSPPPELIVLPPNATISDLKREASKAYQEIYLIFRRFQAEELLGYGGVDESTQVKLLLGGSTQSVRVRGICLGKNGMMMSRFKMERGVEPWTVDCTCGAKDDDGERMLACDICGVWQHTRCAGIPDLDAVPSRFVCYRCSGQGQATETSGLLRNEETMGSVVVGGSGGSSFESL